MQNKSNRWKHFFHITGFITATLVAVSFITGYFFNKSIPENCESCGMAAIFLLPLWLITIISALILVLGFAAWLYKRITNRVFKGIYIVAITFSLLALLAWLI